MWLDLVPFLVFVPIDEFFENLMSNDIEMLTWIYLHNEMLTIEAMMCAQNWLWSEIDDY